MAVNQASEAAQPRAVRSRLDAYWYRSPVDGRLVQMWVPARAPLPALPSSDTPAISEQVPAT